MGIVSFNLEGTLMRLPRFKVVGDQMFLLVQIIGPDDVNPVLIVLVLFSVLLIKIFFIICFHYTFPHTSQRKLAFLVQIKQDFKTDLMI